METKSKECAANNEVKKSIKKAKSKDLFLSIGWTILGILVVLLIWQLIVSFTEVKKVMPGPIEVLDLFFRSFTVPIGKLTIQQHALASLSRVMVGFSVASVCGILVGLIMGVSRLGRAIIKPIFDMLRPIPPIAWIPLAILWFGIGEITKYFIIFLGAFVLVTANAALGATSTDPELVGASKMLGARGRQVFWKVVLPSALPQIFSGLQVALSTSWMAMLTAEMVRSTEGTGWIIIMGSETGNTTQILAGMIAIAFIGLLLMTTMRLVERRLCSWNVRGK